MGCGVSALELASIQADLYGFMDKTCDVLRFTSVSDNEGGTSQTWATIATVPCLVIDAMSPAEQTVALQNLGKIGKKIQMPINTDVIQTDQLRVNGETFRIIGLYDPTSVQIVKQVLVTPEVQ